MRANNTYECFEIGGMIHVFCVMSTMNENDILQFSYMVFYKRQWSEMETELRDVRT